MPASGVQWVLFYSQGDSRGTRNQTQACVQDLRCVRLDERGQSFWMGISAV